MKTIYNEILEKLITDIPELKWIDLDTGQMNFERPPILFPAALITIQVPRAEDLNRSKQLCQANIIIKLCFDYTGQTSAITPKIDRDRALTYFDLIEKVFKTLQAWHTTEFNPLSRTNVFDEQRPDGYKVAGVSFSTEYYETLQ